MQRGATSDRSQREWQPGSSPELSLLLFGAHRSYFDLGKRAEDGFEEAVTLPFPTVLDAHTGFAEREEEGKQLAVVTREPVRVSCNDRINQPGATVREQPLQLRPF